MDEVGQVYMRLGSLELPHDHAQPVWLPLDSEREVEEELGEEGRMVEVVCSSGGRMVWARDSRGSGPGWASTPTFPWALAGVQSDLSLGPGTEWSGLQEDWALSHPLAGRQLAGRV